MNASEIISKKGKEGRVDILIRLRRKAKTAWEKKKAQCKALEQGSNVSDAVGNIAKGIGSIPVIGEAVSVFTAPLSVLAYVTSAGLNIASSALDCDKLPFDEIKNLLNERFNEVERKLDQQSAALDKVSKIASKTFTEVEKTRSEMSEGFKLVLDTIQSQNIKSIVFSINNFIRYFDEEREILSGLSKDNYITKLQEPNSILFNLKDSRTPKGDSLSSALYKLTDKNNNYAIPKVFDDNKAYQALYGLFYGTQAYVSIMFFLLDEFSYLADYHYESGNDKKFNKYFDLVLNTFTDFKFSLVGGSHEGHDALIDNVIDILNTVKEKKFIRHVESELYQDIANRTAVLHSLKAQIKEMDLPLIEDRPKNDIQISFNAPLSQTPIGDWVDGTEVTYAVQYEFMGKFSKISEWSDPFTVRGKANPSLTVPVDQKRRNRLIFRKFNKGKPQLVHVMKNTETSFRDLNRDLYNAALSIDKDIAVDEVERLIIIGADISSVFDQGKSVMHAVALRGNEEVAMKFLLKNNSTDINIRDKRGYTPLHIAAAAGRSEFVNFLLSHEADVNAKTERYSLTALHLAASNGFPKTVESLLKSPNIIINQQSDNGYTALHAATDGGFRVLEILLKKEGIDINAKSDDGLTPFHLAAMNGDIEVVQTLVKSEADLNARDVNDMTAMHLVAMDGSLEMLKYLLSLKEKIDINSVTSQSNWTPLHFAIQFKKENAALELLKDEDVNLNIASHDNITVLHLATATGQANIVKELLNRDINLEEKTDEGYTALHLGAMLEESEIVKILIEKGANVEARSADNLTPLHQAAKTGRTNTLVELIDNGADMSSKTPDGSTALHLAVDNQQLHTVQALLKKGADAKATDDNNYLPIHKAMLKNDAEIVQMFTRHDPSLIEDSVENVQSSLQLIIDILMKDIYSYYINNYDETQSNEEIFQRFVMEGKLDTAFIFNSSEDSKIMLKSTFFLMLNSVKLCLEIKRKQSMKSVDSSTHSLQSINSKECIDTFSHYLDRRSNFSDPRKADILPTETGKGYFSLN